LKEAEGLVEMWKEIVDTYAHLKEKLNYDDECNYLDKFADKKQALGEHIQAEVGSLRSLGSLRRRPEHSRRTHGCFHSWLWQEGGGRLGRGSHRERRLEI